MVTVLALLGCVAPTTAAGDATTGLHVDPSGWVTDRNGVRHATRMHAAGKAATPRFQRLLGAGDTVAGVTFGQPASRTGALLPVCGALDYSGLWAPHGDAGELEMMSHFECQPGALFRSAIDTSGDVPRVTRTERVDATPIEGGAFFCAGAPTAWASHLAGEEYEPDARQVRADGTMPPAFEGWEGMARWHDGDLAAVNPWDYGWVVEVPAEGPAARRFAMGRFSHELAVPMPDRRTVYLTDDTYEGGALFLFQADKPGDLSAGTLWAARWDAHADGGHRLTWRSLGHATDAAIAGVVARRPAFTDLYDVASSSEGRCKGSATTPVWTTWGAECLTVRPGMEQAASRLESRRAAALAGATTELIKMEGAAVDPEGRRLFLSLTRHEKAATAGSPVEAPDHLGLAPNACGAVWALDLGEVATTGGPAPSGPWVATSARPFLMGTPEGDRCREGAIANPDNLAWLPETRTLLVAEDGRRHARNALWAYDVASGRLQRVLEAPPGAEVTGIQGTRYRGSNWLSVAFQHPAPQRGADVPSFVGVLGPLPSP